MLIYVMGSCPQAQRTILCVYNENCIFVNVIVFNFVFSAVFIGEGQNLTNCVEAWYSLEQYIGLKEDKLSSTTLDFIRSEGNLETKHLY